MVAMLRIVPLLCTSSYVHIVETGRDGNTRVDKMCVKNEKEGETTMIRPYGRNEISAEHVIGARHDDNVEDAENTKRSRQLGIVNAFNGA